MTKKLIPLALAITAISLFTACDPHQRAFSPFSPSPTAAAPLPPSVAALEGNWHGTLTDWLGTADVTVTFSVGQFSRLVGPMSYAYSGRPPDDFHNSQGNLSGGPTADSTAVVFRFSGRTVSIEGACWAGTFTAAVPSSQGCARELSGTYELHGQTDECFNPPRDGTFTLRPTCKPD